MLQNNKKLKASRYNYFIEADDNSVFGYNFLHRTIIRMPLEDFLKTDPFFEKCKENGDFSADVTELKQLIPEDCFQTLYEANFLVSADCNELDLLKLRYYRSLFANDSLSLVVLPTLWCNLDCPYCFEYKKPVSMSNRVETAFINWIKTFTHKKNINIAWFGGEPLLNKDLIIRVSERVRQFCSKHHINYFASMTTNGFFLDREFQSKLPSLGLKHIQITLDGDRPNHDQLRRQRNGEGSFDRIVENIVAFCEEPRDCALTLRVNCSNDNYEGVTRLLNRFPESVKKNTDIFFRWIWSNEATGYQDFSAEKRGSQPFKGLADLYEAAGAKGWKTGNPHHNGDPDGYCEVDFLDHYNIDPEGNVYLCTHTFKPEEAIGSVLDDVVRPENAAAYAKWYTVNPFDDEDCIRCKLLPFCWGGCREARYSGLRQCIEERRNIGLFVKNIIDEKYFQKIL